MYREDWLYHHGIKGQKWGIRRFQNPDGSLTPEGRKRYNVAFEKSKKLYEIANKQLKKGKGVFGDQYRELAQIAREQRDKEEKELTERVGLDKAKEIDDAIINLYSEYDDWFSGKYLGEYNGKHKKEYSLMTKKVDDLYNKAYSKKTSEDERNNVWKSLDETLPDYYKLQDKMFTEIQEEMYDKMISTLSEDKKGDFVDYYLYRDSAMGRR